MLIRSEERFSRNAETELVCRLLLEKKKIVGVPRFHHQFSPDVIEYEPGSLRSDEISELQKRGHTLKEGSRKWGNTYVLTYDDHTDLLYFPTRRSSDLLLRLSFLAK